METVELLLDRMKDSGFNPDSQMIERFETFHRLLLEWNRKLNLISLKDEERVWSRHILESAGLALCVDFTPDSRVMDLGSGAGFPGIPLKIVRPDLKMTLVESRKKKAAFIQTAVEALGFSDSDVLAERAEDLSSGIQFDYVVTRAVADLSLLMRWCRHTLKKGGSLIALKGPDISREMKILEKAALKLHVVDIRTSHYVPFHEALRESHSNLVIIKK